MILKKMGDDDIIPRDSASKRYFSASCSFITRKTQFYLRTLFDEMGFTLTEALILLFVCDVPNLSQAEVAMEMALDNGAVARSLKSLEKKGLVVRVTDPENQRIKRIFPTRAAELPHQKIRTAILFWENHLLEVIPEEDRKQIVDLLNKLWNASFVVDCEEIIRQIRVQWEK